jgi:hypothetical protein
MKALIKEITPKFIWNKLGSYKQQWNLYRLKHKIISYMERHSKNNITDEQEEVLTYLKCHPFAIFPYDYTKRYSPEKITVYMDSEKGMYYVLQDSKRLYFKKCWTEEQVQVYFNSLLIEQDAASPHRYETPGFHVSEGDVVVDAGVAEGNFALSIVDKAKKLYLFEVDETWIEVLKITFAPWKEKTVIVNKYVSNNDNDNCITLDTFFGQEKINFIKTDIEGAEPQLLKGANAVLSRPEPMKVVLCTYHKHNDADVLNQMLMEKGFHTEFSKGYMIFEMYDKLQPPYLRRGLIRAVK